MKRLFTITGVILLLMGSVTAFAEKPEGCNIQGSWMGYDETGMAYYISSIIGQSSSNGVYILDVPGFPITLYGQFPTAEKITPGRGVWTKTGDYTFAYTLIAITVDSNGNSLYISKLSGSEALTEDCNSMWIDGTLEFFKPYENPFESNPFMVWPTPGHWGKRMIMDPFDNP